MVSKVDLQAKWSPPAKAATAVTVMTAAGSLLFVANSIGVVHTLAYEVQLFPVSLVLCQTCEA